jgi:mono/diheme cytochrome c family protein
LCIGSDAGGKRRQGTGATCAGARWEAALKALAASLAVLILLVVGAAGAVLLVFRGGISARTESTPLEETVARRLRRAGIPRAARDLRSPASATKETVAEGRAHFADHCAICHANDGSGGTEMGRNLHPRAPDLRLEPTQDLTDGELFYIIENGIRLTGMPGWGDGSEESKKETWHLVAFLRHLPRLAPQEKLEMERLNPKSPEEWREMQEDEEFLRGKEPARRERHRGQHQ